MDTQHNNTENEQQHDGAQDSQNKGGIHNNALYAASMGRAATAQVRRSSGEQLANTGTNIIYEGATPPGGGGSVGTGFASGQPSTGASISTDSDYDQAEIGRTRVSDNSDDESTDNGDSSSRENDDTIALP